MLIHVCDRCGFETKCDSYLPAPGGLCRMCELAWGKLRDRLIDYDNAVYTAWHDREPIPEFKYEEQ